MNDMLTSLTALTGALLKTSLQASLVIALVLAVQWFGRKHLSPRVRYALWLLVALRLALPISLESSISIFHWATPAASGIARAAKFAAQPPAVSSPAKAAYPPAAAKTPASATVPKQDAASAAVAPPQPHPAAIPPAHAAPPSSRGTGSLPAAVSREGRVPPVMPGRWPWPFILSLTWLAGVVFLLGRIIWIPLRLNRQLARHETETPAGVFEILEQAKRLSGVNQVLPIVQSRAVQSPALLGFIRPWLLLPHGMLARFTPDELRLVLLHELAHLKRRDIAVNWLTTLLQILHWFNPLVWFAFARMRADREEACDELALSFARPEENRAYGHAMIKLLEGFARPAVLPGLVGILEDQTHMERRITMIAQFKRMTRWSAAAAGLLLVLGLVTLTDAQTEKTPHAARIFTANAPTVRTLLSGTSEDVYGILSPDESAVAYVQWGDKGAPIFVRDLRTGVTRKVVAASEKENSYEFPMGVVWSPDSKRLAYQWEADDSTTSLRIVSREGGTPKIIGQGPESGRFFRAPSDWSKDGARILVEMGYSYHTAKPPTLATVDVATGEIRAIGPEGAHARFSPDGRHVVCERIVDGNREVFVGPVDGSDPVRVTNSHADDGCPIFSADGKWILFSSNRRGHWDLWAMHFADGRPAGEALPVKYNFGDHTKWLMASGKIAFTIASSGVDGREASDIYKVDVSRARELSELRPEPIARAYSGRNVAPAYSPDGKKIAYVRWRGPSIENPVLCIHDVRDGTEKVCDPAMRRLTRLFWSPDGRLIGLAGVGNEWSGGNGTYLFSVAEGKRVSQRLKRANAELGFSGLMFSADGKEILTVPRGGMGGLAIDITTGAARPMRPEESPFRHVSLIKGESEETLVYSPANGGKRIVARVKPPATLRSLPLSPNGAIVGYVVVTTEAGTTTEQMHLAATDGSWNRMVDTRRMLVRGGPLNWAPDSTSILLTLREDLPGEIGILENFLPPDKLAAK